MIYFFYILAFVGFVMLAERAPFDTDLWLGGAR